MKITFNEIEKILKTLPIGYYLKRNVDVTLDPDSECSYYVPMDDTIRISFKQLEGTFESIEKTKNVEKIVRGMLYHEVSHAFITPKNLRMTSWMNIFEDERIESVLRHYYLNTNFRELVKFVNNFKGEKPANAKQAFYQLVRYRVGDKDWLKRLHELIQKYKTLNRRNEGYELYEYEDDVQNFYENFMAWYKMNHPELDEIKSQPEAPSTSSCKSDESSESTTESDESDDESDEETDETTDDESDEENDEAGNLESDEEGESDESLSSKEIDNVMSDVLNELVDKEMIESVQQILQRISKSTSKNGSAINAYSGVFDPRSVVRDDYKYFVQQNRIGHVKAFSKVHLNLFIDRSGSFRCSQDTVNKLLYSLRLFENSNPNFTFDLVTCGMGERLETKKDRIMECRGGNKLDHDVFDLFKKLQFAGQTNYNIVLFDGDAFSDYSYRETVEARKNFGAFNASNVTIISDYDNKAAIEQYACSAKKIFTYDYADELCKNVMNALQMLTR
jgi:hypothetical protein